MSSYSLPFPNLDTPLHLLVVDDQEFDSKMICARLKEVAPPDTVIVEANSGETAIRVISQSPVPFHCVLLDMNLPDINGVELTSTLLNMWPELSIVMITVEADMDKALKCIKAGAEDFLIKGEYTNMGLYRSVRYAIERHRATIENGRLNEDLQNQRRLSEAQKVFINLVSHEFRTPIAIISGALQLLGAKAPELRDGAGAPQFQKINAALTRLVGLLDNVVRLSLVEEGKQAFTPEKFDMGELLSSVLESFDESRVEMDLGNGQGLLYYGDQRLVEYALHNIISNGIKYSPEGTRVKIIAEALEDGIEVSVIDQGTGMSAETVTRVGEKFYRADKTSHIEGTGLGLHLAQRFVKHHGGAITFDSELGKGTTVRLFFPHAAEAVA